MRINHKKLKYEYEGKTTATLLARLRKFETMTTRTEEVQVRYDVIKKVLLLRGDNNE